MGSRRGKDALLAEVMAQPNRSGLVLGVLSLPVDGVVVVLRDADLNDVGVARSRVVPLPASHGEIKGNVIIIMEG